MPTAATADLRRHLSRYLKRVRRGERIVVTDRGEPIAEMVPYQPVRPSDAVTAQLASLAAQGYLSLPHAPLPVIALPDKTRSGEPAATAIADDRE